MDSGVLGIIAAAIVSPFASLFAFGLIGWLCGAGLEAITRSRLIAVAGLLIVAVVTAIGGYLLLDRLNPNPASWNGALAMVFVLAPGLIGFVIGGMNGVTR